MNEKKTFVAGVGVLSASVLAMTTALVLSATSAGSSSPSVSAEAPASPAAPSKSPTWSDGTPIDMSPEITESIPWLDDFQKDLDALSAQLAEVALLGNTKSASTPESLLLGIDNPIINYTDLTTSSCSIFMPDHNAYYCSSDDSIYISSWVRTLPYGARVFVYAHEDGHSEDPSVGGNVGANSTFVSEQYADRFGGMRMCQLQQAGKVTAADVQAARTFVQSIGSSDHGTGDQRLAAFDAGCAAA